MAGRASFRDIRDEMARRIAARVWQPGAIIPAEEELAREFGSARATVNRALQELARAGIVERKRKAGTRVALHPVREARFVIPLVRQEIEAEGRAYRYRLLGRAIEPAPADIRAALGLAGARRMLHLRCLHLADERPWQVEDRWINLAAVPAARAETFETIGPNEWLVHNAPISRADFVFRAARASAVEADALGLDVGEAVFVGERMTWLGQEPVTHVRMVHPPTHTLRTSV
ncbi:MAG: GntR family transcriptional regulator [Mesorhizobium sp.]|nr:GntR family transcriptional regulator [Mesorhizobium sp.]